MAVAGGCACDVVWLPAVAGDCASDVVGWPVLTSKWPHLAVLYMEHWNINQSRLSFVCDLNLPGLHTKEPFNVQCLKRPDVDEFVRNICSLLLTTAYKQEVYSQGDVGQEYKGKYMSNAQCCSFRI